HPKELTREWADLQAGLPTPRLVRGLSRFIHFASARGVAPNAVNDALMCDFLTYLEYGTLHRKPRKIYRLTCSLWSEAARTVPDWLGHEVAVPSYRKLISLPKEQFPSCFNCEIARWAVVVGHKDIFDKRSPKRPLRPTTVDSWIGHIYRFASTLVHAGVAPGSIVSLADLVTPENFERGFRHLVDDNGGKIKPTFHEIANTLVCIAKNWVKLKGETLDDLREIKGRLRCRKPGLTAKNR